jgi:hypothetical protein
MREACLAHDADNRLFGPIKVIAPAGPDGRLTAACAAHGVVD